MQTIYLDNNATTQPAPEVIQAMQSALTEHWANPSSVHRFGMEARREVDLARAQVCDLIGCKDRHLTFTSGATEANNTLIHGVFKLRPGKNVIISSNTEHAATKEPLEQLAKQGVEVIFLPVAENGLLDPSQLEKIINERAEEIALVMIHWANNETGVIQPIVQLGNICRENKIPFLSDATQVVGKLPVNVSDLPIDAITFSAHKFHGPKGIGAMYVNPVLKYKPYIIGGPHEREKRGGTENVPGIVGMGVAANLTKTFLASNAVADISEKRDQLEQALLKACPNSAINGEGAPRLWNTLNIGFPRLESEAILLLLSERGICASAGAACSSGSLEASEILQAMNIPEQLAHGSIRLSLSRYTTDEDINNAIEIIPQLIARLNKSMLP